MKKKLMILGAGYYQLPLIRRANALGHETIVCSTPGDYPGIAEAGIWENASTMAPDACLAVAKRHNIDGICVCGTDVVMPTLGRVVDAFGLRGPGFAATERSTDKAAMKAAFMELGVRTAPYAKVTSLNECQAAAKEWGFPVVMKVVDSSGSKGIAIVKSAEELEAAYPEIIAETQKSYIIVEAFVEGEEFGAQAFVADGELTFVMPHGDMIFWGDTGVPVGHYAPFEASDSLLRDIREQLTKCVAALDISYTAINADFILKDGQVFVLEIGARAGSTLLPELVSVHYGIDYYDYLINAALGGDVSWKGEPSQACVVEVLTSEKSGELVSYSLPPVGGDVLQLELIVGPGSQVTKFKNAYHRIGHLVVKGESLEAAQQLTEQVKSEIVLELK